MKSLEPTSHYITAYTWVIGTVDESVPRDQLIDACKYVIA
jgi:hypothetical protein